MNAPTEQKASDSTLALNCRCCGEPMGSYIQPLHPRQIEAGRKSRAYVTCWNEDCSMYGFTLDGNTYADKDLSAYIGDHEDEVDDFEPCRNCGGDGKVDGWNRSGGWSIASRVDCPECGGKG